MSSIKWRTDFESLEDADVCLCVLEWHVRKYVRSLVWWITVRFFSDHQGKGYRTSEVMGFVKQADLIASFNEQFPEQPEGEKS